jgi:hypothetical protein
LSESPQFLDDASTVDPHRPVRPVVQVVDLVPIMCCQGKFSGVGLDASSDGEGDRGVPVAGADERAADADLDAGMDGSGAVSTACDSARSQPARVTRTARTRSWPGLRAQLLRCISHRSEGLIHVMRVNENGDTKRRAANAASAHEPIPD